MGEIGHYDGTAWAMVDSPPFAGDMPVSVACASATDCWAVGSNSASYGDAVEHDTGSGWVVVNPAGVSEATLRGIACTASGECWAVGSTALAPAGVTFSGSPGLSPRSYDLIETNAGG
jgi:hypothetical protein